MYEYIQSSVHRYFQNSLFNGSQAQQKQTFSTIKKSIEYNKNENSQELRNILNRTEKDLRSLYENNSLIEREVEVIFSHFFTNSVMTQSSKNGMFGMLRRAIIQRIANNPKISEQINNSGRMAGYKNLFKGYYSEVLKTRVVDGVLSQINSAFSAHQAGDKPNQNNVQTEYDIVLGRFKNKVNLDEAIQSAINSMDVFPSQGFYTDSQIEMLDPAQARQGYGIQSKLWILPDELKQQGKKISSQFYMIGSRGNLHNSIGGGVLNTPGDYDPTWRRGWSYNVLLLSRYLITVLGQSQLMYGVGKQFIWTGDLIRQMRANNLYVSFYYSRKEGDFIYPSTSDVVWDYSRLGYRKHMQAVARAKSK